MSVSHDASSESHTGTTGSTSEASFGNAGSSALWNHVVGAGAKAAWVGIGTLADADYIDGDVTLGGVAMTQHAEAADTLIEPLRATLFFLANPPTGSQNIVVPRINNATPMYGVCHTVFASADVEIYTPGIVLLQESQTLSEQSVDDGSPGTNSLRFAIVGYGGNAPAAGANSTVGQGINVSAASFRSYYETTAGQGSRPIGASTGTADDVAAIHFAIREITGTSVSANDSGVGSDAVASLGASLSSTDTGAASDALAASAALTLSDAASASDAIESLTVAVSVPDDALGSDSLSALSNLVSLAESATGADAVSLITDILKAVVDNATGSDAIQISVTASVADAANGADTAPAISALVAIADTFVGVEVVVLEDGQAASDLVKVAFLFRARRAAFQFDQRELACSLSARKAQFQLAA